MTNGTIPADAKFIVSQGFTAKLAPIHIAVLSLHLSRLHLFHSFPNTPSAERTVII